MSVTPTQPALAGKDLPVLGLRIPILYGTTIGWKEQLFRQLKGQKCVKFFLWIMEFVPFAPFQMDQHQILQVKKNKQNPLMKKKDFGSKWEIHLAL